MDPSESLTPIHKLTPAHTIPAHPFLFLFLDRRGWPESKSEERSQKHLKYIFVAKH